MRLRNFPGTTTLVIGIALLAWIYHRNQEEITIDLGFAVVGAVVTVLGIVMQTENSRMLERERRAHELEIHEKQERVNFRLRSYEINKGTYDKMRNLVNSFLNAEKSGGKPAIKPQDYLDIRDGVLQYGSYELVAAWELFNKVPALPAPATDEARKIRQAMGIMAYAKLELAMRHDLGREDDGVDELMLLRLKMNDFAEHETEYRRIQHIKSVAEYAEFERSLPDAQRAHAGNS